MSSSRSYIISLSASVLGKTVSNAFLKSKRKAFTARSFIDLDISLMNTVRLVSSDFPFESLLTIPFHFHVIPVFENGFQDSLLYHLHRDWSEAEWSGSSFLPFLKIGLIFTFLPSRRSSPNCHALSKMICSGLTVTPVSSLCTHAYNSWGSADQRMAPLFKCSLTSLTEEWVFLVPDFSTDFRPQIPESKCYQ